MVSVANSSTCAKPAEVVRRWDVHNVSRKVNVSPNESLLIASQRNTRRRGSLRGGNQLVQDEVLMGGTLPSEDEVLMGGALENLRAWIPMLGYSQVPEDLLLSTMSPLDSCSRYGSVSRMRKIERDFANHRPRVKI